MQQWASRNKTIKSMIRMICHVSSRDLALLDERTGISHLKKCQFSKQSYLHVRLPMFLCREYLCKVCSCGK